MPVVRVWNGERTKKKTVVANNLQELVQKGSVKCEIHCELSEIRVVLEGCGTDIEDDDVFEFLCHDKVFMLLCPGEMWNSETENIESQTMATESNKTTVNMTPHPHETESSNEQVELPIPSLAGTSPSVNGRDMVTMVTKLPQFTDYIKEKLSQNKTKEVWSKVINISAEYYLDKFPNISHSSEYQAIGEKMYRMYPDISHSHGSTPWALFCKDLSQRIRWLKWSRKKKSTLSTSESPNATPKKLFRLETSDNMKYDETMQEDYEKHVEELNKEFEKRQSNESVMKMLLKETHNRRIQWIKTLPRGTISPILKKFPILESGRWVLYEFSLLIGKKEIKDASERLAAFQDAIEDLIGEKKTGPLRFLPCLQYVERNTQMDKGKGVKSRSILIHKKDIPDEQKDKSIESKEEEAPKLVLFTEGTDKMEEILVVGDQCLIYTNGENFIDGVFILLAIYYIFDLQYPRQYTQLLGCLQDYVMNEPYTGPKSKKYIQFTKELNKKLRK